MNIFSYFHFLAFFVYMYLAVYILVKDYRSILNRVFSLLLFSFSIVSLMYVFLHNPNTSEAFAKFSLEKLGFMSFGYPYLFFWIVLIFIGAKKILKSKIFYLFFTPPLILSYFNWRGYLFILVKESYGWAHVPISILFFNVFSISQIVLMLVPLIILLIFGIKTKDLIKKKQIKIIFTCTIIALIIGWGNVFINNVNVNIPNVSDLPVFILCAGLTYAITKYKFLTITPALAADIIIDTMPDLLFLLDENWNIIGTNRVAVDVLGYKEKEMIGQPIKNFINRDPKEELNELVEKKTIKDRQMTFVTKTGNEIEMAFSGGMAKNKETSLEYAVVVTKDIRVILEAVEGEAREKEKRSLAENYAKDLEVKVDERTKELSEKVIELEKWREIIVGRELQMVKLKEEIKELKQKYGEIGRE